jgi:hypothetical protein
MWPALPVDHAIRECPLRARYRRTRRAGAFREVQFLRLVPNGIAQYFAYFLFGAPTLLSCTFLELRLHVIVEVSNHQLSHDLPFIMIS